MRTKTLMRRGLPVLLSVCCSAFPGLGQGQTRWTEDDCMRYAVEHNLRLRNRQIATDMARADVAATCGSFLPSVDLVSATGRHQGHSLDPYTNQYTSESFLESTAALQLSLPLFEGLGRVRRLQFHRANRRIQVLQSRVEANGLALEVLEAFYRYCFDREMCRLAAEQRQLGVGYCRQTREYVALGLRARSDLQEAEARLQSDVYQETVSSNRCRLSLLALKELMNLKKGDSLAVVPAGPEREAAGCPFPLAELCSAAAAALPDYRVMALQEKAARRSWQLAKGKLYPALRLEFSLNTGYCQTERDPAGGVVPFREQWRDHLNRYVGVRVSFPLFGGLSRLTAARKEKLRWQQVRNENELQRLSLDKEIREAYLSFQAAAQECRLAGEQLRADSILWKECEAKWAEGLVATFELMEKRHRYLRAKAETVRTALQYRLRKRVVRFYREGTFL